MPPAKSTTAQGTEHEKFIVDLFEWDHAQRSKSSGASFHDPVDVTSDNLVVECESTERNSYKLTKEFWQEVVYKSFNGKLPMLAVRFRDKYGTNHTDLVVLSAHDVSEIFEELEARRLESLS